MAWQWLAFGAPVTQRSISVGGGAAYLDLVTDGITGKVLVVQIKLNQGGHIKVANDVFSLVDDDLDAGVHTFPVVAGDQWVPEDLGTTVAMSVRWQAS